MMPLYGTRDVDALLEHAAVMERLDTEPVELPRVEVLQVMFEIDDAWMQRLLPRALHPTIPPTATFVFWRCQDGPFGPFELAQVRAGCRAGVRPRSLLLASWCNADGAAEALRSRWGFNCRPAEIHLRHNYDRVTGTVETGDRTVLQVSLLDPQAISGADVQYTANMNLARVRRDSDPEPRLVQIDPDYTFHRAERGRPSVDLFERDPSTGGVVPVYPVSATFAVCDITLPRIRYLVDPDRPAIQATEPVGAG
jgi:hypothetical protein